MCACAALHRHESFDINAPFLTPTVLLKCATAFRNASKAVKGKAAKYVRRVDAAGMPTMYVYAIRRLSLTHAAPSVCVWVHSHQHCNAPL